MSQRERDRLKVLHEVQKGHLTQRAGGGAVGADGSLGAKAAGAAAGGGRPRGGASVAGPAVEPEVAGGVAGAGGGPGASGLPGLWPDAGRRVPGAAGRDRGQQGDAAAVVDGGGGVEGAAAAGEGGPHLAAAAGVSRRTGAVGHLRACLAGRARPGALPDYHDRRRHQPAAGTFCAARLDGGEPADVEDLSAALGPPAGVLHGPGELV